MSGLTRPRAVSARAEGRSSRREARRVSLFVLGAGQVGGALLRALAERRADLQAVLGLDLAVVGVANSSRAAFWPAGLDPIGWRERAWPDRRVDTRLLEPLARLPTPILVDCTAADGLGGLYREALRRGVHVVTANKKALAAPRDQRDALFECARDSPATLRYETTVGAALPIISTVRGLLQTGDRIHRIDGALSGSLSFICDQLNRGAHLDEAVVEAMELGYTEPRPQVDLGGLDAARKALILAREADLALDLPQVDITPLVPAEALAVDHVPDFVRALRRARDAFSERMMGILSAGKRLRFLAAIDPSARPALRVGPVAVDAAHPAAGLVGGQSLVALRTARYATQPLVVQGAGAGADVTAAGVLADVIAAASSRPTWHRLAASLSMAQPA